MTARREFPDAPRVGVGAVVVNGDSHGQSRVLLVQRGSEPMKGRWTLPGGLVELGETLTAAVTREIAEETGLQVEPFGVVEVIDKIYRIDQDQQAQDASDAIAQKNRPVRYHYVIVDYLCRLVGGQLRAATDAAAVRWVAREEWISPGALDLDPVTARVIEKGWRMAFLEPGPATDASDPLEESRVLKGHLLP